MTVYKLAQDPLKFSPIHAIVHLYSESGSSPLCQFPLWHIPCDTCYSGTHMIAYDAMCVILCVVSIRKRLIRCSITVCIIGLPIQFLRIQLTRIGTRIQFQIQFIKHEDLVELYEHIITLISTNVNTKIQLNFYVLISKFSTL